MVKCNRGRWVRRYAGVATSKLDAAWNAARSVILGRYGSGSRGIAGLACVLFVALIILDMMSGFPGYWIIFLDLGLALSGAILTETFRR